MLGKAVVAEGVIEALDEGILHWFFGLDVVEGNPRTLSPEVRDLAGELGTIIDGDGFGTPASEG